MEGAESYIFLIVKNPNLSPSFYSAHSLFQIQIKLCVWEHLQDAAGDVGGYLGVGRVFMALSLRSQPVLQAGLPESH